MTRAERILETTTTRRRSRDLHWIRGALQSAIAIEHATMPLYAAAMYSLEVQNYPAYNLMRAVLMEEMLHMAAACNALAAIGGAPRIRQLDPWQIRHGLPASIAPGFTAHFAQLSRRQLGSFMRIESPVELLSEAEYSTDGYPTIGSFYQQIIEAIEAQPDAVRAAMRGRIIANQVGGNIGYAVVDPTVGDGIEQILQSLELIIDQGEGSEGSTLSSGAASQEELSHYARFAELRFGRAYSGPPEEETSSTGITAEGQRRFFRGVKIAWPQVINMLAVPDDGYGAILRLDPNRAQVETELRAFDEAYTRMLAALDDAWNGPEEQSWPSLGRAVFEMNELRVLSCFNILRHPIPDAAIAQIDQLYPLETANLRALSDFNAPLRYGPRFRNLSIAR